MNRASQTASPLWLRLAAFGLAAGLLLWLPIEDETDTWPLLYAAAFCTWLAVRLALRIVPGQRFIARHAGLGGLMGFLVTPAAVFLMAFKIGWHAHGTPDFSPAQLWSVIQRTPAWTLGGLLIGLGAGFARSSFYQ